MPNHAWALAMLPALGLVELALHEYFARSAPTFEEYAALAPELLAQKRAGVPVVVAPSWAEPLVRQAAPEAFPLLEVARPDDASFGSFLEVSLLGQVAPALSAYRVERETTAGAFTLRTYVSPRPEPTRFDFVSAVEAGTAEVRLVLDDAQLRCQRQLVGRAATGGLHGHVAYPRERYECPAGRLVGVTLIEDADYRPRRCILVQPPVSGTVLLRFEGVPESDRLVGFRGLSHFLERDDDAVAAELSIRENGSALGKVGIVGAAGWWRFEVKRSSRLGTVEVEVQAARKGADVCFALEAR